MSLNFRTRSDRKCVTGTRRRSSSNLICAEELFQQEIFQFVDIGLRGAVGVCWREQVNHRNRSRRASWNKNGSESGQGGCVWSF